MRKNAKQIENLRNIPISDNPDAEEEQMIALSINLAKQQLLDGTASSQVITHYLKLASEKRKAELELKMLEEEVKLKAAKTDAIESAKKSEAMYEEALLAMKRYSGHREDTIQNDDYI